MCCLPTTTANNNVCRWLWVVVVKSQGKKRKTSHPSGVGHVTTNASHTKNTISTHYNAGQAVPTGGWRCYCLPAVLSSAAVACLLGTSTQIACWSSQLMILPHPQRKKANSLITNFARLFSSSFVALFGLSSSSLARKIRFFLSCESWDLRVLERLQQHEAPRKVFTLYFIVCMAFQIGTRSLFWNERCFFFVGAPWVNCLKSVRIEER